MTVRILMYHSISARGSGEFERHFVLPEKQFRAHLAFLSARRIPVYSIDALLNPPARPGVILTFDDAYLDFATTAWPLLRERGFPAAVMVPTGHVGGTDDWQTGETNHQLRPIMDWSTLRRLRAEGVAIESHAVSHSDLRALPLARAQWELRSARERIMTSLGNDCRFVAYPYNRTSPLINQAAQQAGYLAGLAGHWNDDSPYSRRRLDVGGANLLQFAFEALGYRDLVRTTKRQLKAIARSTRGRRSARAAAAQ